MIRTFCLWLGETPISQTIQNVQWLIPAIQSVHILSVAVVMSSILMLDLRLMGVWNGGQAISSLSERFLPWMWNALIILAITGILLLVGEPERSLLNPMFLTKMTLLASAVAITIVFRRNIANWDNTAGGGRSAGVVGILSLALWCSVVVAGRWIAYTSAFTPD